jgi:lysozyme
MEPNKASEILIKHEGLRVRPYRDTTGHLTIGVGRNLDDRGITKEEALYLLENDIKAFSEDLSERLYYYDALPETAKLVLLDMAFNLGLNGLLTFHQTLEHIKQGDYKEASKSMLQSKWAKQVGGRAIELSNLLNSI